MLGGLPSVAVGEGHRRDRAKARLIDGVFGGRDTDTVEADAVAYAASLPSLYRSSMSDRLAWHQSEGHQLVLVTASLGVYARPAADALGFDHVIAVELAHNNGRFTGAMVGPNVRGAEKEVRLRDYLGDRPHELWAYGNSSGDAQMLAMADHATMVRRGD